jgi:hypothetical protein
MKTPFAVLVDGGASPEQLRAALADFLRLPAARRMPAALRAELARRGLLDG